MSTDLTQPWTADPRVAALLAECVATPPEAERHVTTYALTRDEWLTYVGPVADQLRAIQDERTMALLNRAEETRTDADYAALSAHFDQPTVEQAIDEALYRAEQLKSIVDRINAQLTGTPALEMAA